MNGDDDDWEGGAAVFGALAYPNRLQLLSTLREPRHVSDLDIKTSKTSGGGSSGRRLTRQGIRHHLGILSDAGLVGVRHRTKHAHITNEYSLQPCGLFKASEWLRDLAIHGYFQHVPSDAANDHPPWRLTDAAEARGPRLVLVHGLGEGRSFPVQGKDPQRDLGVTIGRSEQADVHLAYDPYAADMHAEVVAKDGGYALIDLRTSERHTYLNWSPLPLGGTRVLTHGDVIGIGRSIFSYQAR